MSKLTVGILTLNEAHNLPRALKSIPFADEIILLDAGSTDDTVRLAEKAGARVLDGGPTKSWADARNRVLKEASGDWVLFLDADEEVSPELAKSIQRAISSDSLVQGYWIDRRDYFMGRLLKHGNTVDSFVRLGRKDAGQWERPVHEIWQIEGPVGRLTGYLYHYSHPSIQRFIEKANHYTEIDAQAAYNNGVRAPFLTIIGYPTAKFIQVYLLKRGFLDGTAGLVFSLLDVTYSFLKRAKIWSLEISKK